MSSTTRRDITLLQIGKGFTLPLEAVTETFLILGQRGRGKSNTAAVIAEELFSRGAPVCVLTPIDNWWGLKSSASGKGPGLPFYLFGGEHADIPLEPTAGQLIADVFIEERISAVVCTHGFSGKQRAAFVTAMAGRLLNKNKRPIHIIVEEADAFIPQRPYAGEEEMLGAMDRLIRWGRSSGIGGTFISQRSAKINKDVTTQCSVLVAHGTVGPQDIEAIKAWFQYHRDPEVLRELLDHLATLPKGTAFFYSPAWLEYFGKVAVRRRHTFDSAATPKLGEITITPKTAVVDLDKLQKQMAETIDRAKAADPAALRRANAAFQRRIEQLQAELAKKPVPAAVPIGPTPDQVKAAIAKAVAQAKAQTQRELIKAIDPFTRSVTSFIEKVQPLLNNAAWIHALTIQAVDAIEPERSQAEVFAEMKNDLGRSLIPRQPSPVRQPVPQTRLAMAPDSPASDGRPLSGVERRFMIPLAQYPEGLELNRLAAIAGYAVNGNVYNKIGALRTAGYISPAGPGPIQITEDGLAALGSYQPLPIGAELRQYWRHRVGAARAKILDALFELHGGPHPSVKELATASGYALNGNFYNHLGSLRTLGLVTPAKLPIAAMDYLFEE